MNQTSMAANTKVTGKTRMIAQVGMLSAIAAVLMFIEFPIPFIAPSFYELDLSEVPVLIGTFAMGPIAGVLIEGIKILVKTLIKGSTTMGVGEVANFFIGISLIVPAGLIYRWKKTKKTALIGMGVGTLTMMIVGCVLNALVLIPAYVSFMGFKLEDILAAGAAIRPGIDSVFSFAVLAVAPFNLIKGVVVSLIVLLLYKHISRILKSW